MESRAADERGTRLLRRMAVFAGGCSLRASKRSATRGATWASFRLDGVSSLLTRTWSTPPTYTEASVASCMLETVREFASGAARVSGERGSLRLALAAYSARPGRGSSALRKSPARLAEWLSACDDERDNMRAALAFLVETANAPVGPSSARRRAYIWAYWELEITSWKAARGLKPCSSRRPAAA